MDDQIHGIVQDDNFAEGATMEMTMPPGMSEITPPAGSAPPERKRSFILTEVASKFKNALPTMFVDYIKNLDPRGKDKMWWAGTTLSTGLSAYLAIQTGGSSVLAKSIATAAASFGIFAGEKGLLSLREKHIKSNYTGENRAQRIAELQEKHRKGTDRMKKFFGGMSAGTIYGGLTGTLINASGDALQSAIDKKAFDIQFDRASPIIQQKISEGKFPTAFSGQSDIDKLQIIGDHYVDTAKDAVTGTASTLATETTQTVGEVQSAIATGINESINPQTISTPAPDLASMTPNTVTEISAGSVKTAIVRPESVPDGILPASAFPASETNNQFVGTIPDITKMTPNAVTEISAENTTTSILNPTKVPDGVLPANTFPQVDVANNPFDGTIKPAPNLSPDTAETIQTASRNTTSFVKRLLTPFKRFIS